MRLILQRVFEHVIGLRQQKIMEHASLHSSRGILFDLDDQRESGYSNADLYISFNSPFSQCLLAKDL